MGKVYACIGKQREGEEGRDKEEERVKEKNRGQKKKVWKCRKGRQRGGKKILYAPSHA